MIYRLTKSSGGFTLQIFKRTPFLSSILRPIDCFEYDSVQCLCVNLFVVFLRIINCKVLKFDLSSFVLNVVDFDCIYFPDSCLLS